MPAKYTCDGERISPPLNFLEVPPGTKTLALIMEDPDVPKNFRPDGIFDHWLIWNIPAKTRGLQEAQQSVGIVGQNTRGTLDYVPPCPPDRMHRYVFTLFALDSSLQLEHTSGKNDLLEAVAGHTIEYAQLIGTYDRKSNLT